jgi:hypothetical protein
MKLDLDEREKEVDERELQLHQKYSVQENTVPTNNDVTMFVSPNIERTLETSKLATPNTSR